MEAEEVAPALNPNMPLPVLGIAEDVPPKILLPLLAIGGVTAPKMLLPLLAVGVLPKMLLPEPIAANDVLLEVLFPVLAKVDVSPKSILVELPKVGSLIFSVDSTPDCANVGETDVGVTAEAPKLKTGAEAATEVVVVAVEVVG